MADSIASVQSAQLPQKVSRSSSPRDLFALFGVRQQLPEAPPPLPKDRGNIDQAEDLSLPVAEQELHGRGDGQAQTGELISVRRQLQQGLGLRVPCQFCVAHDPAHVATSDEVGVALELAVEEGRLVEHIGSGRERFLGPLRGLGYRPVLRRRGPGQLPHPGPVVRVELPVLLDQSKELSVLMLEPEVDDLLHQWVRCHPQLHAPTELAVERAE